MPLLLNIALRHNMETILPLMNTLMGVFILYFIKLHFIFYKKYLTNNKKCVIIYIRNRKKLFLGKDGNMINQKVELKVPKKYQKYFGSLERESGLIDDCPYMLYFADGYAYMGEYPFMPCKSKKEALEFIRCGDKEKNYDYLKQQGVI